MVFSGTQPDDNASIPINSLYRKEDNTFPVMQSEPGGFQDSFSNQSTSPVMSFLRPLITQKAHAITGSGSKAITCPFTSNNIAGNSIIIAIGIGEVEASNITLTITDTNNNTYIQAVKASQSTTLEASIFYAVGIAGGANTITATIAGSSAVNAAIAIQIYECWGLIGLAGTLDQTSTGSNAGSTSPSTGAIAPTIPNELCFAVLASGGGTITAGSNFNLDSGSLLPQGGGIVSFGSQSQALTSIASITPSATLSMSNAWAMATATFKSVTVPVSGTVIASNPSVGTDGSATPASSTLIGASDGTNLQQLLVESSGNRNLRVGIYQGSNEATVTGANALKVDGSSTTQPISGTITANAGTGSFTVAQATGSNLHAVVDSGSITATTNADTTIGGTSAPSKELLVAGKTNDGTPQYQPIPEGAGGRSVIVEGYSGGTAVPVSGTVTSNIGTTNGLALDSSVNGIIVSQGSTTSGEKGPLIQAAVTTSSPSYTTAQTSPLSLTTAGALRTDASATTQPVSAVSLPLPTGASTSAKQPALGTAGSASSDVLTVQGIASMTALKVDGSSITQPISGTVTANAGTGNFTVTQGTGSNLHAVLDSGSTTAVTQATASNLNAQVQGSVASAGSNAGNPVKEGGVFNTTQPTVTNGQVVDAQYTARGAQIVATGVDAFAVNASQSGTWTIQPGNTANTTPWLATINQGGNSATVTGSNALKVDGSAVTQPISGTVTSNIGTTNGLALDSSINGIVVSQGSATSGEKGPLIQAAVTTSSPSYTTAQTSPLSLTTAGALRTDASATTQPVSGTVSITANSSVNVAQIAGTTTDTNSGNKSAGTQRIVIATDQPQLTNALKVDGSAVTQPVSGTFWQATQPVSGTVTSNAGTGNFNNASIGTDGSAIPGSSTMIGASDGTNLQQLLVESSSNKNLRVGVFNAGNEMAVDASGRISDNLVQVGGSNITLGSKTSVNSFPVVVASDQAALPIQHGNVVDTNNSSTATLTSNSVFTGTSTSSLNYSAISIETFADQASAAGGLSVQQSQNGTNWDIADTFSVSASTAFNTVVNLVGQFYRIVYTNGGTGQGTFRLQTVKMVADAVLPRTLTSAGNLRVDGSGVTQPVSGTVSITANSAVNVAQVAGTTTDTNSGNKSAGTQRVVLATDQPQLTNALKVDGSAVTQPISGTITANAGTNLNTSALALDTSVNGILVSQGSTTSGEKGPLIQGAVTTNAPSYTTAQTSPLSLDASGLLRASLKDTPSNTNNFNVNIAASAATVTVSGTVTANQGGSNWSTNVAQIGGTNVVTGGASGLLAVGGPVASGASNADNPVKVGGAFNTTQPTVTNGQVVDAQYTARGAAIVATGVDTFNVTVNTALPAGSNVIGALSANQSVNVAQINGTTTDTNTGNASAGTQRVVLASNQPTVNVSQQASGSASATLQNAQTGNANGTSLNVLGMATAVFTITVSTFTGTVNFEGTEDNSNWSPLLCVPAGGTTTVTTATSAGQWTASCAGLQSIRARTSGVSGGNVTVTAHAVPVSAANLASGSGGSGGTSSSFGSAFPSTGTAIGASDGTNMQGLLVESSSNKNLRVGIYSGANEATVTGSNALKVDGSAVTQPVSGTVTANIGTTNGLALDSSINGILVSQGSTTSGEKGPLIQGAVTTSSPSYTTAQTSPLSLTTAGALRTDASATTQPVSGTVTSNQGTANATPWNENIAQVGGSTVSLGSKTSANSIPVVIASDQAAIAVQHGNAIDASNSSTATLTANSIFTGAGVSSLNYSAISVEVFADQNSAASGLQIQQSQDNANWDISDNFTITASTAFNTVVNLIGQYYRIKYTNGGTGQGIFRLQTVKMVADAVLPRTLTSAGNLRVDGSGVTQPVSGTVSITANSAVNVAQVAGTTTDTNSGNKSAGTQRVVLATDQPQLTNALKVDGSAITQPVSGTITANAGTNLNTSALALDTSVNGILVSQGSTTSGEKGPLVQGAVTTNVPSYTTAQTSPLSLDTSGLLRASLKDTPSNTNNFNVNIAASAATVTVSGTVTANQGGSNWSTNVAQIGGTNVVTGGASGLLAVGGPVASGSSNADNPVKVGGAFNTTQPTVTNGQIVDSQYTARGAAIVATGVDTFNATINAALPAGGNTIGAVTQASGPWTNNVTQFGGNNVATGTGASGTGIPRVTVSNDSELQLWDGTHGPVTVKAANAIPTVSDLPLVTAISPNNTGLPVNLPSIVQSTNNKSSGSVASLAKAFVSNNVQGNSVIVVCGVGNGTAPTISDTNSNTYTQASQIANGTAFNVAIFYAVNIASGANTVTVNNGGTTASIAMEIYEVSGLIAQIQAQPDQTASNTGSSGTASTSTVSALSSNEYAFAGIGVGTAAQTITAGSGWTNDSGQQNPSTPAGLFSFVSMSQFFGSLKAVTPQATFTSEPWAIAVATFRPVILGVEGTTKITDGTVTMSFGSKTSANSMPVVVASDQAAIPTSQSGTWTLVPNAATSGGSTPSHTMSAASTNATSLKGSAGQIYGFSISNANASARYFKIYNKASSPTVGTDTPIMTVQVPANGTVIRAFPVGLALGTGIAWAATTGIADSDTGAVGLNDLSIDIDYK